MSYHPSLNPLRAILAELYTDPNAARALVEGAGIPAKHIAWSGSAVTFWTSILTVAFQTGRLEALLRQTQEEYGGSEALLSAIDAYRFSRSANNSQGSDSTTDRPNVATIEAVIHPDRDEETPGYQAHTKDLVSHQSIYDQRGQEVGTQYNISGNSNEIVTGSNFIQIGVLKLPIWFLIVVILAIAIAIAVAIRYRIANGTVADATNQAVQAVATVILATRTPLPTSTPPSMPEGTFNVAVAEFNLVDAEGRSGANDEGRERASGIAAFLDNQLQGLTPVLGQRFLVWGPELTRVIVTEEDAATVAEELNAAVLIYGTVTELTDKDNEIAPKFYVQETAFAMAEELAGQHALGQPIAYRADSFASVGDVNKTLEIRIEALARVLQGLSYLHHGDEESYQAATEVFHDVVDNSRWAVKADSTGQQILLLFLGNSYLHLANFAPYPSAERTLLLRQAEKQFRLAIEMDPTYPRSYNGLGSALFQLSLDAGDDACSMDWNMVEQASAAHHKALDVPKEHKPTSGHVDFYAHFGIGRAEFLHGLCGDDWPFSAHWENARTHYRDALNALDNKSLRIPSLMTAKGFSHAELGRIDFEEALGTYWYSPESMDKVYGLLADAVDNYRQAALALAAADTQEAFDQYQEILPEFITALCMTDERQEVDRQLKKFKRYLENEDADLDKMAIEQDIIAGVKKLDIISWEECQSGPNQ